MPPFERLLQWFNADLENSSTDKTRKQIFVAVAFLTGIIAGAVYVFFSYCVDGKGLLDILCSEEGVGIITYIACMLYFNLQEDEIDKSNQTFIAHTLTYVADYDSKNGDPDFSQKVEDLVIGLAKGKLTEEVKYPQSKKE